MGLIFFAPFSNLFVKKVVQDLTSGGIDWQREKWQSGLGSKFIHQGEKNAVKYADEVIVLSKGVQDYFKETYGRETHFIPNGVNAPCILYDLDGYYTGLRMLLGHMIETGLSSEERQKGIYFAKDLAEIKAILNR